MDDVRLGAIFRAVRIRLGMRQHDVAVLAGVSDATISRLERGFVGEMSSDVVRCVAAVLEIRVEYTARWRGGDLDRLVNARHARLAEECVAELRAVDGWVVRPEVSFAIFGERGAIDLLAWHEARRALLVIELKTEIVDIGELLATLDRKVRLARRVAADLSWQAESVSVALLVAEGRTNRRRIDAHAGVFGAAYPDDGRRLRRWLRGPVGRVAVLTFVPDRRRGSVRTAMSTPKRVRARPRAASRADLSTN
jgi:transcriptional regulator with XRE-family HTH domain